MRAAASSRPSWACGASHGNDHRSRAPADARTRRTARASDRGERTTTSTARVVRRREGLVGTTGRSRMWRELVTIRHQCQGREASRRVIVATKKDTNTRAATGSIYGMCISRSTTGIECSACQDRNQVADAIPTFRNRPNARTCEAAGAESLRHRPVGRPRKCVAPEAGAVGRD